MDSQFNFTSQHSYELVLSDCLIYLRTLPTNSIDSIVTDPPAGISFMGKEWDKDKGGRNNWIAWMTEIASECLRVLKPGGHAFVWALPKTSHWTATAWEDAGFEVRESVIHIFGSGFPKSLSVSKMIDKKLGLKREVIGKYEHPTAKNGDRTGNKSPYQADENHLDGSFDITAPASDLAKQWDGWGSAVKPAYENWLLFRKPLSEKTIVDNVLKWNTGGINIDDCRVGNEQTITCAKTQMYGTSGRAKDIEQGFRPRRYDNREQPEKVNPPGRFPANLIIDGSEEVTSLFPQSKGDSPNRKPRKGVSDNTQFSFRSSKNKDQELPGYADNGSASRFFYCAKPSTKERNLGCDESNTNNNHPTVKSQSLMRYLITMITPPNGIVLDPFLGSGSTGVAAINLGFWFIGIEKEAEYMEIAKARCEYAFKNGKDAYADDIDENNESEE